MRFAWDETKNQVNIRKHRLDFTDAHEMFVGPMLTVLDTREAYGEDRWIGIGMICGRVVVIAYTERDEETIRVISLQKALRHERTRYEQAIRDELGTH